MQESKIYQCTTLVNVKALQHKSTHHNAPDKETWKTYSCHIANLDNQKKRQLIRIKK